jgi:alkylhydroperoxidase family enzyme
MLSRAVVVTIRIVPDARHQADLVIDEGDRRILGSQRLVGADSGSAVSRTSGITEEKIAALGEYRTSSLFSETEKLALEYADGMTQAPVEVSDAVYAKLRGKFSEAQLVELTAAIAWENYRARFDHAFGIESERFTKGSYCAMPVRPGKTSSAGAGR